MTTLRDLFDPVDLQEAIDNGHVKVQRHPLLPYRILNYTDQCSWDRAWTPVTVKCRGLIVDDSGRVLARGFDKFWNHNEPESAGVIDLDEPVTVTTKEDGSLGILYPVALPNRLWDRVVHLFRRRQYGIATRGSFMSTQAVHATAVWHSRYAERWAPPKGMTALFEIVYPANRIVLDYNGLDDLILLGFVETATGRTFGPRDLDHGWSGPVAGVLPFDSFTAALAHPPREGAEGYVVHFRESDRRVKIKGSWYLQMHRLVTGLTVRVLWEHLAVNACQDHGDVAFLTRRLMMSPDRIARIQDAGPDWLESFIEGVPDELYDWVVEHAADLKLNVSYLRHRIELGFAEVQREARGDRKEFARLAKTQPHAAALFNLIDGREIDTFLWRQVRPAHETPFMQRLAEAA